MSQPPAVHTDADACADATIDRVGTRLRVGTPLGIGKANHLVNALYRRARDDRRIDLRIFTALTLTRPRWSSDLERRLVQPLSERIFGGYPELDYVEPMRLGTLPPNVRVHEFYFRPGAFLHSPLARQQRLNSNYSHVVRDLVQWEINVLAQLVAPSEGQGRAGSFSLSGNPDLTLDLVPQMRAAERRGARVAVMGQANRRLPFMYGDAEVDASFFDGVLDAPAYEFPLFAPPNGAVTTADYLIGLNASALVRDGGTLQLGIGSLGDAVTYALMLRHQRNDLYCTLAAAAGLIDAGGVVQRVGGTDPFDEGLYAASEMLVHGFLELYRCGILTRRVSNDPAVQRRLNEGNAGPGETGTHVAHACFFLGPESFYDALRRMPPAERALFGMTGVRFVNDLDGDDEPLKRLQRRRARFINTGLTATLGGAVSSDALDDGRVISGVGGQHNFVAMAHSLEDGRSILLIRSTREQGGRLASNILATRGGLTIPAHLRDIVVTEYGIADLRGRTDEEVATSLIELADAAFQDALVADAQRIGILSRQYGVPERCRANRPDTVERLLEPHRANSLFPRFPFGTDLTPEEIVLGDALQHLKRTVERRRVSLAEFGHLTRTATIPAAARPYLARMALEAPSTVRERLLQRAVVFALAGSGAI